MEESDVTLPRGTIQKLIQEVLPEDIKCPSDTIDLFVQCCIEFVHLISSEANEICTKENKKMLAPEHIVQSLKSLGFDEYIEEVQREQKKHKDERKEKPKGMKKRRLEQLGIPQEQLLEEQQKLFAAARSALQNRESASASSSTQSSTKTEEKSTE